MLIHIQSVQHVALVVTNLDKAKRFYEQALGLQPLSRPAFDFPGAWYSIGSQQLHLLVHRPAQSLRNTQKVDSRDGHFAIRIDDYDTAVAHLSSLHIEVKTNPNSVTGWKQIFLCDPDGNVIELNAPTSSPHTEIG